MVLLRRKYTLGKYVEVAPCVSLVICKERRVLLHLLIRLAISRRGNLLVLGEVTETV